MIQSLKKPLKLAIALAAFAGVQTAHAVLITDWNGVAETTFSAQTFSGGGPTSSSNPNAVLGGGTRLEWGTPFPSGTPGPGSSLEIGNNTGLFGQYDTALAPNNGAANIQTNDGIGEETAIVTHDNVVIFSGTTLESFTVTTQLFLTPAAPPGPTLPTAPIDFSGSFNETANAEPCVVIGSPEPCNDIFVLSAVDFSAIIPGAVFGAGFADFNYLVELFDPSGALGVLPDAVCADAGAGPGCLGFTTPENTSTSLTFNVRITAIPVEVAAPAALGLLGLNLLGLGLVERIRRRRAAA